MKICGIIRPKSIKIVAELDNYDFPDDQIETMNGLYNLNVLPMKAEQPNDLDIEDLFTCEYPVEKIIETLDTILSELEPRAYLSDSSMKDLHHRLKNLVIVASSLANLIEEAIDELKGAPLVVNVNMDSWLEKPAGYNKETDDE